MYEKYAKLRDERKMTDYSVCQETGISPSSMSDWKRGLYNLKTDKLLALAKFFDVSLEYFIE